MRVRVSDPALCGDLVEFLGSTGCETIQTGSSMLAVALADPLPYGAARMELDYRLAEWRDRNAPASAIVID